MRILGVDCTVLGIDDLADGQRFYRDFGLEEVERGQSGGSFLTLDGSEIRLRCVTDPELPPGVVNGPTIREIVWGVPDDQTLDLLGSELQKDRPVYFGNDRVLRAVDNDGYGLAFRVSRRRAFEPGANSLNIFGGEERRALNSRVDFSCPVKPATVGHVVLFTPDVSRAVSFYVERLGFRLSDLFKGGRGAFLRAAGSSDHHTLFLVKSPEVSRGLHHISFHVTDFHEVMIGGKKLTDRGWKTKFGPGRHVIGSNCFWYFQSPCGGAMELACDMDHADDNWRVREWDFLPENVAGWSVTFNGPTA